MLPHPSTWTAPKFQFGMTVLVRERTGQITGLDYYTHEQAVALETTAGWWYYVFEQRTVSNGKVVSDVAGYHESVIQPVPCDVQPSYSVPSLVSR
jgi:hypothetical protein